MNQKKYIQPNLFVAFIILISLTLWGCSSTPKNRSTKTAQQQKISRTFTPKVAETDKPKMEIVHLKGEFRSTTGVMNHLSCYCNEGGYVTDKKMGETAVCFDKLPNKEKLNCGVIAVEGFAETVQREPHQNDPCPAGEMKIIIATQATCY